MLVGLSDRHKKWEYYGAPLSPGADFNLLTGTSDYLSPLVIADLECLGKCRQQDALYEKCFGNLLGNVTSTGTDPVVITGYACDATCAEQLYTAECQQFLKEQPSIIQDHTSYLSILGHRHTIQCINL